MYPGRLTCEWGDGCTKEAERHHKDGNPNNNARNNVAFLCRAHHIATDNRSKRPEVRAKVSAALTGRKLTEQHRLHVGDSLRGRPKSAEHKAKLSAALKGRPTTGRPRKATNV